MHCHEYPECRDAPKQHVCSEPCLTVIYIDERTEYLKCVETSEKYLYIDGDLKDE